MDVGTGTGRLVFQLSDKCGRVNGIDLSLRNIETAKQKLKKNPLPNAAFYHSSVEEYLRKINIKYDYAVLTYVIHEIDENKRRNILINLSKAAGKIIMADYLYPGPKNIWSFINEAVEFAAGFGHYSNFKNYMAGGGITGLAERSGLKILNETKNLSSSLHIAVLQKR